MPSPSSGQVLVLTHTMEPVRDPVYHDQVRLAEPSVPQQAPLITASSTSSSPSQCPWLAPRPPNSILFKLVETETKDQGIWSPQVAARARLHARVVGRTSTFPCPTPTAPSDDWLARHCRAS
ncbi:hypothetical protein RRG08_034390 [Elysia crispata]|uniref:Uncharacterized protein n=1 Tax=Elysia crispata TaxID=231223 RepID=A0AAE1CWQ1_9GAST|nr:hypothetical protein RRG08_034390 [Elysia crispata]